MLIIFFVLASSGCSLNPSVEEKDWEDEILLASECGQEGLKCCAENPNCLYGQECCVSPVDNSQNYCAQTCEYGILNSFCRAEDPACDTGLSCRELKCVVCGEAGAPCCGQNCNNGLYCHNNTCVQCGLEENPCCNGQDCASIQDMRLECRNGLCTACGSSGRPICEEAPRCLEGQLETDGLCINCGRKNQPCCQENSLGFCLETELECRLGFCGASAD